MGEQDQGVAGGGHSAILVAAIGIDVLTPITRIAPHDDAARPDQASKTGSRCAA